MEAFKVGDRISYKAEGCGLWTGTVEEVGKKDLCVRWDDDGKTSHVPKKDTDKTCSACEGRGHCENVGAEIHGKFYGAPCSACDGTGKAEGGES